ncbi:Uncharacterized protein M6B38_231485 [Iris pallida]|uniref:Uncharacterized protein n=1 Tax=Iris pallida TaxID=29817 RepID=A0AAX6DR63_IRIPA|nr:Uncharacterized protein M6B38_231485 [Iris pallida]
MRDSPSLGGWHTQRLGSVLASSCICSTDILASCKNHTQGSASEVLCHLSLPDGAGAGGAKACCCCWASSGYPGSC